MNPAAPRTRMTEEEYLAFERAADTKHEFFNGEMFAMAGGSFRHNRICHNLHGALWARLRGGPCRAVTSDQRLNLNATRAYTYPDAMIVCGSPEFTDGRRDTLANPRVVIEVLSPSTAGEDLGAKLGHYRRIESVREILFVDSRRVSATIYRRMQSGQWQLQDFEEIGDEVPLCVDCALPLAEIYEDIDWNEPDEELTHAV